MQGRSAFVRGASLQPSIYSPHSGRIDSGSKAAPYRSCIIREGAPKRLRGGDSVFSRSKWMSRSEAGGMSLSGTNPAYVYRRGSSVFYVEHGVLISDPGRFRNQPGHESLCIQAIEQTPYALSCRAVEFGVEIV